MQAVSFSGNKNDSLTLQVAGITNPQVQTQTTMPAVEAKPDTVEVKTKAKKEKVPFRQKFLNFIATIKKTGVNISEYGAGFFKGLGKSLVAGVATVGALFTGNQVAKAVKSGEGKKALDVVGDIFKNISTSARANLTREGIKTTMKSAKGIGAIAAAVVVGAGIMIKTLYNATLDANQRKHNIDEKYQKTPAVLKK